MYLKEKLLNKNDGVLYRVSSILTENMLGRGCQVPGPRMGCRKGVRNAMCLYVPGTDPRALWSLSIPSCDGCATELPQAAFPRPTVQRLLSQKAEVKAVVGDTGTRFISVTPLTMWPPPSWLPAPSSPIHLVTEGKLRSSPQGQDSH